MILKLLSFLSIAIFTSCVDLPMKLVNTTLKIDKGSFRLSLRTVHQDKYWTRAIDQRYDHTWVYTQVQNNTLSSNSKNVSSDENGTFYEDNFFMLDPTIVLDNFPVKVVNITLNSPHSGGIGLTRKFANESHSMVHLMKKKGYINHLAYSFLPNDTSNGLIYFGGIPEEVRRTKKGGICKVNTTKKKWSCELRKVKFGYFEYTNKFRYHFQVGDEPIYAPFDFIEAMNKRFFKDYFDEGTCSIVQLDKKSVVKCKMDEIKKMPEFNITFNDFQYTLNAIDLFDVSDGKNGYLNILQNPHSNNTWQIGITFLRHFDTLFDYEGESIEFFSNTHAIEYVKRERFLFFLINLGVLVLGIALIALIRYYSEDNEEPKKKEAKVV